MGGKSTVASLAEASPERLAHQAIAQLEATLRSNPPTGTTSDDVTRVFSTARNELEVALANLIAEAQITPEEADLRLTSAAGRALRSLAPPRIARLARIAQASEKGFSVPYHGVPPQEAAAWTRELKNLHRWELVTGDGWLWRLTPLGQRVLQLAQESVQTEVATYATKYRMAGGPLPATPQSARMVLGGKALKLPDEAFGPLLQRLNEPRSRRTYPDGRWIAEAGDEVYAIQRGFGGTPASVRGRVEESSAGKLRVRVTGTSGFFNMPTKARTMAYSESWTVVGDPRPEQIRQDSIARESQQAEQWWREQKEYEAEGRRRATAAVARGEQFLTPVSSLRSSVTNHLTGATGKLMHVTNDRAVIRWGENAEEGIVSLPNDTITVGGSIAPPIYHLLIAAVPDQANPYILVPEQWIRVVDLADARQKVVGFTHDNKVGPANWRGGQVLLDGSPYAQINHQGRILQGETEIDVSGKPVGGSGP